MHNVLRQVLDKLAETRSERFHNGYYPHHKSNLKYYTKKELEEKKKVYAKCSKRIEILTMKHNKLRMLYG